MEAFFRRLRRNNVSFFLREIYNEYYGNGNHTGIIRFESGSYFFFFFAKFTDSIMEVL